MRLASAIWHACARAARPFACVLALGIAAPPSASALPSIASLLGSDGRLLPGASGSFSAEGYALAYAPDGAPRFVRAARMSTGYATGFSSALNNTVWAIAVSGTDVYVGGQFTDAGGVAAADYVARWDGTAWNALGAGTNGAVHALAISGSDLYVGGAFANAGGVAEADNLARWNGTAWSGLGGGTSGTVRAIAVTGTDVYVGGGFTCAYVSAGTCEANTRNVARWNGTAWNALGTGVDNVVWALAASGSDVYVGGQFGCAYASDNSCDPKTRNLARWSSNAWSSLGAGTSGTVWAIAVTGTDVYVGGGFTCAYSTNVPSVTCASNTARIARWNGTAWNGLGVGVDSAVRAIAVSGSDVFVGGQFTCALASGSTCVSNTTRIARWNSTAWNALGAGVNDIVYALAVGTGEPVSGGAAWPSEAPASRKASSHAASSSVAVPALYLGGQFTATNGGTPANYFTYYTEGDALPVELTSFTARDGGTGALLSWTTASETNNAGFQIEQQAGTSWRALAFVAGRGTTSERTSYSHTVTDLTPGTYRFRLRQVDLDGTTSYSPTVEVTVGLDTAALVEVHGTSVRFAVRESQTVRAELYTILGQWIATLLDREAAAGQTTMLEMPAGLSAGVYLVRLTARTFAETARVVVR